jgi:hypothetical protein
LGFQTNTFIILAYGLGLGLVLDEFPHWIGNIKELTRNVTVIPAGLVAVVTAETILILLITLKILEVL